MKKEYSKFLLRLPMIITVLALLVFVGIPVSIYLHDRVVFANPNNAIMEDYWMISLPKKSEMKQIMKEHTPYGPHGEATHHSIYEVKRSKIQFTFRADPSAEIEDACKAYCDKLETQSSDVPDFSQKYSWFLSEKNQDTLILLYFSELGEFHIFEVFF